MAIIVAPSRRKTRVLHFAVATLSTLPVLFLLRLPVVRFLHRRQLLFPLAVVFAVVGVLAHGSLYPGVPALAVRGSEGTQDAVTEDPTRSIPRSGLEKTPLAYFSDYWGQLANEARASLLAIGPSQTPAIVVAPGLALTTVAPAREWLAARDRAALNLGETPVDTALDAAEPYRLRHWDEDLGLALFEVSAGEPFALADPLRVSSGSYIGAVTLDAGGAVAIAPGHLVSARREERAESPIADPTGETLTVSIDLPERLSLAAVINLDGALLGVAYDAPDGRRVVSATTMLRLVEDLQNPRVCRAVDASDLTAEVRALLDLDSSESDSEAGQGAPGVLVEYVDRVALNADALPEDADIRSGDILLEWGGEEIHSSAELAEVYDRAEPGASVSFTVRRALDRVRGEVVMPDRACRPVSPAPVQWPALGLALQWATAVSPVHAWSDTDSLGWVVVAVADQGPAALAGVVEGDGLVAIGNETVGGEAERPRLADLANTPDGAGDTDAAVSAPALLLTVRRGQKTKMIAVSPSVRPTPLPSPSSLPSLTSPPSR